MKLGDEVQVLPSVTDSSVCRPGQWVVAQVIYIDPRGRYFCAQWGCPRGEKVRECFAMASYGGVWRR